VTTIVKKLRFPGHAADCLLNFESRGIAYYGCVDGGDMGRGTGTVECSCAVRSASVLDQIRAVQSGKDEHGELQHRVLPCNPAVFHKGQSLQVWSKVNGTYRGDMTVERVTTGHLIVDNIPAGSIAGDLLIFSDASRGIQTPEKTGTASD
jgi:hypothetical protein